MRRSRLFAAVTSAIALGLAPGACSSPPTEARAPERQWVSPLSSAPVAAPPAPSAPAVRLTAPSRTPGVTAAAKPATYAFPVVGANSYAHTHHDYPATDIITRCGNRVVAVTTGTILDVTRVDNWKRSVNAGATRGGLSVSLLGDDGVRYYGSHLSVIEAAVSPGARVTTGQTLGRTGDTGDAGACHLHFGISPPCARVGDWWNQRGTVYPWPYLDAWRKGKPKSAAPAVADWQASHGCPKKPLTLP
jgi:murein DD-endopeptidase MepM/ murein hydrolase activator NlpD